MQTLIENLKLINERVTSINWNDVMDIAQLIIIIDKAKVNIEKNSLHQFSDAFNKLNDNIDNLIVENYNSKEVILFTIEMNAKHLYKIISEYNFKNENLIQS